MNDTLMTWVLAALTVAVLGIYELAHRITIPQRLQVLARKAHATLREDWLDAMEGRTGQEIVAIQTLRNSMMSSTLTLTASTTALGLLVTVSLATANLKLGEGVVHYPALSPRLLIDMVMVAMLLVSVTCSTLSVRYFNHSSFIVAMPIGSDQRNRWNGMAKVYVHRAGVLYGWGLRALLLVIPLAAFIIHPTMGPLAAMALVTGLRAFDRVGSI